LHVKTLFTDAHYVSALQAQPLNLFPSKKFRFSVQHITNINVAQL